MKIKRANPRKRMNTFALACGCLSGIGVLGMVLALAAYFLIVPALPNAVLQSAGFEHVGDTDSVFADANQSRPVLDSVQSEPEAVVVQSGNFGQQTIDTANVQIGTSNGQQMVQLTFTESDLLALCQQMSDVCGANSERIRNARFDLRPGGMVVYGDVFIEQVNIWQSVGVVLRLTADYRLAVGGVDINGQLYAAPPNEIGATITEIESVANEVLRQLTVQASGTTYTVDSIYIDDTSLILTMR